MVPGGDAGSQALWSTVIAARVINGDAVVVDSALTALVASTCSGIMFALRSDGVFSASPSVSVLACGPTKNNGGYGWPLLGKIIRFDLRVGVGAAAVLITWISPEPTCENLPSCGIETGIFIDLS